MAEIDVRGQAAGVMTLNPGNEYLVMSSVSTAMTIRWEMVGDKSFDVKVKGVTLWLGFVPNPFNSDWIPAVPNYKGSSGWFGMQRNDTHFTLYLLVRTTSPDLRLRFTGAWEQGGGIKIPF